MYSGFVTSRRTLAAVGVHQRFDKVAYRVITPYLAPGTFPELKQILHFEGINGPDGLKVKSPGKHEPSHIYDPLNDVGPVPTYVRQHYDLLVKALEKKDMVRASFDAAWLAHYVCDGLTPAHHFPLDKYIEEKGLSKTPKGRYKVHKKGDPPMETMRTTWQLMGGRGVLTTHFNFEMGAATVLLGHHMRIKLDAVKLAQARKLGPVKFFKQEARAVADLEMYELFNQKGWSPQLARLVKTRLAPQTVQTIGIIWLLAYLKAGHNLAIDAAQSGGSN